MIKRKLSVMTTLSLLMLGLAAILLAFSIGINNAENLEKIMRIAPIVGCAVFCIVLIVCITMGSTQRPHD